MMPNVYISVPVTLDWTEVNKVIFKVKCAGYTIDVNYWSRTQKYDSSLVNDCDIFMFMTPYNNWDCNINTLPSGVFKELNRAISLGKQIFMVYKNTDNQYNFYQVEKINNTLRGVVGSSTVIWETIETLISAKKSKNVTSQRNVVFGIPSLEERLETLKPITPKESVDYDPRLLL